jgi:prepilin-type N-terminal cleavage/methylation domain-containing protein
VKQRRGAKYAQHKTGFTLVELLIVVALLGTLLGMGLGLFARLDLGDRVVRTQVVGQLRAARTFASTTWK